MRVNPWSEIVVSRRNTKSKAGAKRRHPSVVRKDGDEGARVQEEDEGSQIICEEIGS